MAADRAKERFLHRVGCDWAGQEKLKSSTSSPLKAPAGRPGILWLPSLPWATEPLQLDPGRLSRVCQLSPGVSGGLRGVERSERAKRATCLTEEPLRWHFWPGWEVRLAPGCPIAVAAPHSGSVPGRDKASCWPKTMTCSQCLGPLEVGQQD